MKRTDHRTIWKDMRKTNEGLVRSWNNEQFIKFLERILVKYGVDDYSIDDVLEDKSIVLKIHEQIKESKREQFVSDLKNLLSQSGFYPVKSNFYKDILSGSFMIRAEFLKKFSVEAKKIPEKLYHVTHPHSLGKIDKYGLVPKSKKLIEDHPDRIYFTTKLKDAIDFGNLKYEMTRMSEYKEFVVFEVSTTGLDIKLYSDPLRSSGTKMYYTLDNIPRANIEVVYDSRNKKPGKKHILTKLTDYFC